MESRSLGFYIVNMFQFMNIAKFQTNPGFFGNKKPKILFFSSNFRLLAFLIFQKPIFV